MKLIIKLTIKLNPMKKILLGIVIISVIAINVISNLDYSKGVLNLNFFATNAMAYGEYPDCGPLSSTDQYYSYVWASGRGWRELKTYTVWTSGSGFVKVIADNQREAESMTGYSMYVDYTFTAETHTCDGSNNSCCTIVSPKLDMWIH